MKNPTASIAYQSQGYELRYQYHSGVHCSNSRIALNHEMNRVPIRQNQPITLTSLQNTFETETGDLSDPLAAEQHRSHQYAGDLLPGLAGQGGTARSDRPYGALTAAAGHCCRVPQFANEGHGFREPAHQQQVLELEYQFYRQYL